MALQWMQCNWIQTSPTWADSICSLRPDTHDGSDSGRKKRYEDVPGFDEPRDKAAKQNALRKMLQDAIDPQPVPVPEEAVALAKPFSKRLESGAIKIDWKRLEREAVVREQLYAMAREHERKVREFEEDEEDVNLLLWM